MKFNRRWLAFAAPLWRSRSRSWSPSIERRRAEGPCGRRARFWRDRRLGGRRARTGHGRLHQVAPEREGDEGRLRR